MDTNKNAPQERGAEVIRSPGKPAAHYKSSTPKDRLHAYYAALAQAEANLDRANLLRWKEALIALPEHTL